MDNEEILLIDDEVQIRKLLQITLSSNGYRALQAPNASEGLRIAAHSKPDLILLDLGLPDENGHITLKKIREWYNNPVIVLSVQSGEEDIIKALDNGANDYLVKPFRTGELLARIRSALRNAALEGTSPVISCKGFEIDLSARTVRMEDKLLRMTGTQYSLMVLFARNEGKVLTHQYILRQVWGPEFIGQTQYLRVFVAQLRKKIEKNADRPEFIFTESGVGYRFIAK